MRDLWDYLDNYGISGRYPHRESLLENVCRMSEENAAALTHGLWEGYNVFTNPESLAGTLERIYGEGSPIPIAHRDMVFRNLISIAPDYAMNWDSENEELLAYTWVVFDAVGGEEITEEFSDEDRIVYQSAVCITNHIFKEPRDGDLKQIGFARPENRIEENPEAFTLDGTEALEELRRNIKGIEYLRDALRNRYSLHADVIREIASAGVLGEGTL